MLAATIFHSVARRPDPHPPETSAQGDNGRRPMRKTSPSGSRTIPLKLNLELSIRNSRSSNCERRCLRTNEGRARMKKLEALIDPFTLRQVKAALTIDGVVALTISEVRRAGDDQHVERYRGTRYSVDW